MCAWGWGVGLGNRGSRARIGLPRGGRGGGGDIPSSRGWVIACKTYWFPVVLGGWGLGPRWRTEIVDIRRELACRVGAGEGEGRGRRGRKACSMRPVLYN